MPDGDVQNDWKALILGRLGGENEPEVITGAKFSCRVLMQESQGSHFAFDRQTGSKSKVVPEFDATVLEREKNSVDIPKPN